LQNQYILPKENNTSKRTQKNENINQHNENIGLKEIDNIVNGFYEKQFEDKNIGFGTIGNIVNEFCENKVENIEFENNITIYDSKNQIFENNILDINENLKHQIIFNQTNKIYSKLSDIDVNNNFKFSNNTFIKCYKNFHISKDYKEEINYDKELNILKFEIENKNIKIKETNKKFKELEKIKNQNEEIEILDTHKKLIELNEQIKIFKKELLILKEKTKIC
jgi:hypothetical protein